MTLEEAVGIRSCDIDIKTGRKLSHQEVYGRFIEFLGGLDAIAPFIPFSAGQIDKAIVDDEHLNNLSMDQWDRASGFYSFRDRNGEHVMPTWGGLWSLYSRHGITTVSNSQGVCVLKEAARLLWKRRQELCDDSLLRTLPDGHGKDGL